MSDLMTDENVNALILNLRASFSFKKLMEKIGQNMLHYQHFACSGYRIHMGSNCLNHRQMRSAGSLFQYRPEVRSSGTMGRGWRVKLWVVWRVPCFFFFWSHHLFPPLVVSLWFLTKEAHSAPAALMKKSSWSCFTGGGLSQHAHVKRKLCCNGQRSRFKS